MCCPLRPVACQAGDEHEPAGAPRKRCYLSDLGKLTEDIAHGRKTPETASE